MPKALLDMLLSHFSCVWLCATPYTAAHQAPPSLGFSRQEHWSGLPFPSPMHESGKWKWSRSVCLTLCNPMDCSLRGSSVHGIFQARVLEWVAMPFSKFYLLLHNKPSPSFGLKPTHFICSIFCRSTVGARLSRMILLLVSLRVTNTALGWYSNIVCVRLPVVFIGSHVSKVSLGLCGDKEFPAVSEQILLCTVYLIC